MCVRTAWQSLKRDRRLSERRLESRSAAAPHRKRQLDRSIERSLPRYQFCVMFSVETTRARALRCSGECSNLAARSTAMTEAEQPMPPRLYAWMLERIPKRLTIIADSDG